jgi:hypothetical protein
MLPKKHQNSPRNLARKKKKKKKRFEFESQSKPWNPYEFCDAAFGSANRIKVPPMMERKIEGNKNRPAFSYFSKNKKNLNFQFLPNKEPLG